MSKAVARTADSPLPALARGGSEVTCDLLWVSKGSKSMQSLRRRRVSRLVQAGIVVLPVCFLAGCSTSLQKQFGAYDDAPDRVSTTVRNADLSARFPATDEASDRQRGESSKPLLFPGTEPESPAAPSRDPGSSYGVRTASLEPVAIRGDGVEINFEGADVPTVAKALLGDVLHLNFVVDPKVQGTVTLGSVGPIPRKDLLPTFESVLRMQNAAIVRDGKFMKIVPIPDAAGHASVSAGAGEPGFGVSVVPLRYISATTVAKTAENMLARPGAIRVDQARNLLLIQGTASEREAALDVVSTFDVEWLRNQSVGVYPLKSTSPETMIGELERIFETGEGGVGQGVLRLQPISRMNAVMVVTKNPKMLAEATQWVQRLDRSDTTGTTLRTYRLKHGSAVRVARILNEIFVGQRSGAVGDQPANQIAPGVESAQSRLDSLDRGGSATTRSGSAVQSASANRGGNPIA